MKTPKIWAVCVSLPFLLSGAYYLNLKFQKSNASRLQECQKKQDEIVKKNEILEAERLSTQQSKPLKYEHPLMPGYKISSATSWKIYYPKLEVVDACTWIHRVAERSRYTTY